MAAPDPLSKAYLSASASGAAGSTAPGTPLMPSMGGAALPPMLPLGVPAMAAGAPTSASAASAAPPPAANISNHNHGMVSQHVPHSAGIGSGSGGPGSSPVPSHHRSQSSYVPMHSPHSSLQFDGLGMGGPARAHGSMGHNVGNAAGVMSSSLMGPGPTSAAGILATTPSAAAVSLQQQQQQLQQPSMSPNSSPSSSLATPDSSGVASMGAGALGAGVVAAAPYDYPTRSSDYDVFAEIGSGAFSTVYRGCVRESGEPVAIKVIDLDMFNTNWDEIRKEIMIQAQLQHPNVVKLKTAFVDGQDLWIVMSLLTAGSCASVMKELGATNGLKDEVMIATILKEVLQALAYFHKHGSIHRDVKAGNILISGSGDVQLADFGVAGTLMEGGDRKKNRQTFTGTPCWMAPEVMEHTESEGYDQAADIWSFGITAMELGYGRAPYAKYPPMKVMLLTLQEEPPTAAIYKDNSYEFSKHYHSMIAKCLRRDPKKRPTVRKLLEHKFFQKAAPSSAYLYENLVKRLPVRQVSGEKMSVRKHVGASGAAAAQAASNANGGGVGAADAGAAGDATLRAPDGALLHPSSAQQQAQSSMSHGGAAHPGAGVKLGSWIFDEEEISSFKTTEGAPALDLLTGTLQHQVPLPHHHHHQQGHYAPGAVVEGDECDDVDEPDDNEEEQGIMQQQQQQAQQGSPLSDPAAAAAADSSQFDTSSLPLGHQTSPFGSHVDLLSAAAAFAASSAPSPASPPAADMGVDLLQQQQQQQQAEEPHDFFADVSAPAQQATLVPLSPSAAFAVAATGAGLPPLGPASTTSATRTLSSGPGSASLGVGGAGTGPASGGVSNTVTPTLSSVQGRTRQFLVSEEEMPSALPVSPQLMTDAHVGGSVLPHPDHVAMATNSPGTAALDLLSDDLSLDALSTTGGSSTGGSAGGHAPSASQQYLNSLGGGPAGSPRLDESVGGSAGADRSTTPLSFDSLSLAPGSATLAYLAAAGGVDATSQPEPASHAHAAPPRLDRPLSEARPRMNAAAASAAESALSANSSPNLGSTRSANAGSPGSRMAHSGNHSTAPGLQLLDMTSPPSSGGGNMSNISSGSSSGGGMLGGPRSLSAKRGSGTLASLGLGLLPVQMPVLRQAPAGGVAAASSAVAGSPSNRGMPIPVHGGASAMPPSAHSPVGAGERGSSIFNSSSPPNHPQLHAHHTSIDSHPLALNIPSPSGHIQLHSSPIAGGGQQAQTQQSSQQAGQSQSATETSGVHLVGRFQVTSSGVAGDQH